MSEATLAWALADGVSVCFTALDRLAIYTALGSDNNYAAIELILDVAVRKQYPLPAKLICALATWLDCYLGDDREPTMRSLLDQIERMPTRLQEPVHHRRRLAQSPSQATATAR